jgi:hypothetical protein
LGFGPAIGTKHINLSISSFSHVKVASIIERHARSFVYSSINVNDQNNIPVHEKIRGNKIHSHNATGISAANVDNIPVNQELDGPAKNQNI